ASVQNLGPLNVMIANAGIAQVKALLDLTEDDVRRMFEVNVFGVFNCYSAAAKQMIKQGTPSSVSVTMDRSARSAYDVGCPR
ncbi:MAG: SDR family NAD(P)-dependent oxidoreductase, partial [Acidimicrobiales bacterium]